MHLLLGNLDVGKRLVMPDTTVTKVDSTHSPRGPQGQRYLASGVRVSMRLWDVDVGTTEPDVARDFEVVGFVLEGRAELHLEGQMVLLGAGDSYVVPKGARHHYEVLEHLIAVEATSPPAHVHGRDDAPVAKA
jgi:quercetin dioxygenase-like cupin family protein